MIQPDYADPFKHDDDEPRHWDFYLDEEQRKKVLSYFSDVLKDGCKKCKIYSVCDEDENPFKFAYKVYFYFPGRNMALKFDTTRTSLVHKEELSYKIKNKEVIRIMIIEAIFSSWSTYGLWGGRFFERKMMSFFRWPTKEQLQLFSEEQCWSANECICVIGRDFDSLEPKELTRAMFL